ncbi:MAG: hypothetical protein NT121_14730 [Chloroflexi bacterium]|nr:hypothetical protein [Chloroflexota bacterium]
MLFWRDYYWLIYVSSPSHFSSKKSRLVLLRSKDAHSWQEIHRFSGTEQEGSKRVWRDIRDPKLGLVKDQLFVYALLNKQFDPQPYKTIVTSSKNGEDWAPFEDVTPIGWLMGRPTTQDGITWYAPAHRVDQGTAALFRSTDGANWTLHSTIFEGKAEHADETAIHFLSTGQLVAVTRLEAGSSLFGSEQASTLISMAAPAYTSWDESARSAITRLDGPVLFSANQQLYAVGRYQPQVKAPYQGQGSAFSQKRTALFLVTEKGRGLVHLTDLPSAGDTSYAGVAVKDEKVLISYYTNDPRTDYPWIIGMLRPTRIQMTEIQIANLKRQEDDK